MASKRELDSNSFPISLDEAAFGQEVAEKSSAALSSVPGILNFLWDWKSKVVTLVYILCRDEFEVEIKRL
jgi:hypothetical protein